MLQQNGWQLKSGSMQTERSTFTHYNAHRWVKLRCRWTCSEVQRGRVDTDEIRARRCGLPILRSGGVRITLSRHLLLSPQMKLSAVATVLVVARMAVGTRGVLVSMASMTVMKVVVVAMAVAATMALELALTLAQAVPVAVAMAVAATELTAMTAVAVAAAVEATAKQTRENKGILQPLEWEAAVKATLLVSPLNSRKTLHVSKQLQMSCFICETGT
uniref:Uncharacterized protein n=1 Tax=Chrysotila carterae TaxID=13221 RepID=A0A7S4BPA2_CHRCT